MKNSTTKAKWNKGTLHHVYWSSSSFSSSSSRMNNPHNHNLPVDRQETTCIRFTYKQSPNTDILERIDCIVPFDSLPSLLLATTDEKKKKEKTVRVGIHSFPDNTTEVGIT